MAKVSGSKSARPAKPGAKKKSGASTSARASKPRAAAAPKKPAKKAATGAKKKVNTTAGAKAPKSGAKARPSGGASKPAKSSTKPAAKAPTKASPKAATKPAKPPPKGASKPIAKAAPKAPAKSASKPVKGAKAPSAADKKKPAKAAGAPSEPKTKKPEPPARPTVSITDARDAAARMRESAGLALVKTDSVADSDLSAKRSRATKTALSKKEMDEYRQLLILKRAEIAGDVSAMETEALTGGGSGSLSNLPQHMADQGSDAYDQSLSLDLAASQRKLLKEIDDALDRIEKGTYGVCEMTGKQIGKARLNAKPWAKHSIEAARQLEYRPYTR